MKDENKYHWYLVSGSSTTGNHNKPFGLSNQNITKKRLAWFKECLVEQSVKAGFPCRDLIVTNISYLGEMTQVEFLDGEA